MISKIYKNLLICINLLSLTAFSSVLDDDRNSIRTGLIDTATAPSVQAFEVNCYSCFSSSNLHLNECDRNFATFATNVGSLTGLCETVIVQTFVGTDTVISEIYRGPVLVGNNATGPIPVSGNTKTLSCYHNADKRVCRVICNSNLCNNSENTEDEMISLADSHVCFELTCVSGTPPPSMFSLDQCDAQMGNSAQKRLNQNLCEVESDYADNQLNQIDRAASAENDPNIIDTFGKCELTTSGSGNPYTKCKKDCIGEECNRGYPTDKAVCVQCYAVAGSANFEECLNAPEGTAETEKLTGLCSRTTSEEETHCVTRIAWDKDTHDPISVYRGCSLAFVPTDISGVAAMTTEKSCYNLPEIVPLYDINYADIDVICQQACLTNGQSGCNVGYLSNDINSGSLCKISAFLMIFVSIFM